MNEKAYGKRCHYLAAATGGEIEGILPLVHMKGPLTGNRLVSLPFLDQAGVLARNAEASDALRDAASKLASEIGAGGVDLRELAPASGDVEPEPPGRVTLVLALDRTPDELWKSFKPKVRNQVRKAERAGLLTRRFDPERIDDFYPVFARNMRDLGSPVHSRAFLREVMRSFGDGARLYLTQDSEQTVVGGAVALRFGPMVTVPWASSLREYFSSCPNHSLYWKILGETAADGAASFDFGRSYVDSGTYHFKRQWGAEVRRLAWTAFDASGARQETSSYKPSEHRRLTDAWRKLPLPVANLLGPLIRRQLAN